MNVVRWAWSSQEVTKTYDDHAADVYAKGWEASIYGDGETSIDVLTYGGTVKTHGFYIDGKSGPSTSSSTYWRTAESYALTYSATFPSVVGALVGNSVYYSLYNPDVETSHNPRVAPWTSVNYALGTAYPPDMRPGDHYSYSERKSCSFVNHRVTENGSMYHLSALVIPATDCSSVYIGLKRSKSAARATLVGTGGTSNTSIKEWRVSSKGVILGEWVPEVKRQISISNYLTWRSSFTTSSLVNDNISTPEVITTRFSDTTLLVGGVDSEIFYPGALRPMLLRQVASITSGIYNDARYNTETLSGGVVATTSGYPTDITLFVGAS